MNKQGILKEDGKSPAKNVNDKKIKGLRMHYGYIIVACCCLMMGINVGIAFSCAGIFYRPVSESLGVSVGEFGIYMSVMYVTSTLMLPLAGRMIERYSARLLFTAAAALMGLIYVSMGLYQSVWAFYIAGGALGITLSFLLYLGFPTLVNRWFHTRVGLMIGICSAASGIGGMIFNPIAGWMITQWGWRWAYAAFGILILCTVTPLLGWLLRDHPKDMNLSPYGLGEKESRSKSAVNVEDKTYAEAKKSPMFYVLILFAFIMMGTSTLNLFIPGYVSDNGFSLEQASLTAASVMAGVTIGKLVLGWINDRNCMMGVGVTTLAGAAGLVLLLAGVTSPVLLLGGAFLFGWAYAGVTVQSAMLTRSVFGSRDYGRIYSVVSIALAGGGALASGGWGLLADATSTGFIFIIGTICLLVAFALGALALRAPRSEKIASGL
ncbi:MAG: MFS transporter [Muribaculum sp.]|nr:MFS transporter [Muribaculum sp.]